MLAQRLREMAFLNKGLEITLTDERVTDAKTGEARRAEFNYAGGIAEFVKHLNRGKQYCTTSRSAWRRSRDGVEMEIALQYNDSILKRFQLCQQHQHGGWRHAPLRFPHLAYPHDKRRGSQLGLSRMSKENLCGDDVREGLVAVVSVKLPQPQFEGQTKGKLNSDIAGIVQAVRKRKAGHVLGSESVSCQEDHQ